MKLTTPKRSVTSRPVLGIFLALAAVACERSALVDDSIRISESDSASTVIAEVGSSEIKLIDVEQSISLELYDIDVHRYRLLRRAVEARLLALLDASDEPERIAEIRLKPPSPPRIKIASSPGRSRPEGSFPIELVAFCNFESSHCVGFQEQLGRILPLFKGVIQYAERDLILPFHRHATLAAQAAYCALEQNMYWQYHDSMYAGSLNCAERLTLLHFLAHRHVEFDHKTRHWA